MQNSIINLKAVYSELLFKSSSVQYEQKCKKKSTMGRFSMKVTNMAVQSTLLSYVDQTITIIFFPLHISLFSNSFVIDSKV